MAINKQQDDYVYHDPEFQDEESIVLLPKKGYLTVSYSAAGDDLSYQSTSSVDSTEEEHEFNASRKSQVSHHSLLMTLVEKVSTDTGSSLFLTVCTLMPMLQGSAVLGIPYAFLVGGFSFLPAGFLICILAEIGSRLLIDCLYEISPRSQKRKRVYSGYDDLALACWGRIGCQIVNIMNFIYYVMNNVVNVVLLFKCVDNILHDYVPLTQNQLGCLFTLLLFPFLFIKKLSLLAYLGIVGTLSVIVACLTSLVVFIEHADQWHVNYHQIPVFNLEEYPVAIGIMMYTLIIAPTLPNIESTMTDRIKLPTALHISFGFSIVFKSVYGIVGVLTFGLATKQLIATNVSELSPASRYIMSIMLILYSISNTSFFNYIILQNVDEFMFNRVSNKLAIGQKFHIPWMIVSRPMCLVVLVGMSLVMPFFALVSGVVGAACGSFLAMIAPILFHLKLKRRELSNVRIALEIILLILSVLVGIITTYSSLNELIKAIRDHHEI